MQPLLAISVLNKHLRFKQAQPEMCLFPPVEDGVFTSLTEFLGNFCLKNLNCHVS